MHKEEASVLFAGLGHPDRVKIVKMLYHNETLSITQLLERMGIDAANIELHLQALKELKIVKLEGYYCSCNKELIDQLMSFITTKCGCC